MKNNKLEIVYKESQSYRKPYGIRDNTGFLFFFSPIHRYSGQEKRYEREILEQIALSEYLLKCLKDRKKQVMYMKNADKLTKKQLKSLEKLKKWGYQVKDINKNGNVRFFNAQSKADSPKYCFLPNKDIVDYANFFERMH